MIWPRILQLLYLGTQPQRLQAFGCLLGPEYSRFLAGLRSLSSHVLSLFWHSPLLFNAPSHHRWLIPPSSGLSLNTPQSQHVAYFFHCALIQFVNNSCLPFGLPTLVDSKLQEGSNCLPCSLPYPLFHCAFSASTVPSAGATEGCVEFMNKWEGNLYNSLRAFHSAAG